LKKIFLFNLFVFLSFSLFAQEAQKINGTVKAKHSNEVLPFAQIVIENTEYGTVADDNGEFILDNIPTDQNIIKVIYAGYRTQAIDIGDFDDETIIVLLEQEPIQVEGILVEGEQHLSYSSADYSFKDTGNSPNDVGQFFKSISGASAVKKGGFAMDPAIRGFKADQLNVQVDGGCKCWGGCPNRMDPPTSHVQSDDIERIEVIKGPFAVRWGPTMGGIVNLVMKRPQMAETFKVNGNLSAGYESNGGSRKERLTLKGGNEKWDFYLGGGEKVFGNYTTGGGDYEIPSAFTMRDYSLKFGINPTIDHRVQLSWRQSFARDVNYPALPMDAAIDDTDMLIFDYSGRNLGKMISTVSAKIYYNTVHHVMDNFDRKNFAMVEAETIADAETIGGRFELGSQAINSGKLFVGTDYYKHSKDGLRTRFVKTNPCNTSMHPNKEFVDKVWQESSIENLGLFADYNHVINDRISANGGLRYDIVKAQINDPSEQFITAYGDETEFENNNLSFTGSLKFALLSDVNAVLSYGRGVRSPDIAERFINHLPIGKSPHEHFGNPNLKPEINDQFEIGLKSHFSNHAVKFNVFYSDLTNYIFAKADSTMGRLYLPCSDPKFTKVFENIAEAYQYGYEVEVNGQIIDDLAYNITLAYLYGQNTDLDEPLPEIMPFTANYQLRYNAYKLNSWFEVSGRSVAKQDRISTTYGETETDGYNIFGMAVGYQFKSILFRLDVHNIFDEKYYDHLNRNFAKNIEDSGLPFYEPGRNVTLNVEINI